MVTVKANRKCTLSLRPLLPNDGRVQALRITRKLKNGSHQDDPRAAS